MFERRFLGFAQIVKDGAGGGGCERLIAQPATIERMQFEVFEDLPAGVIAAEDPRIERSFEAGRAGWEPLRMEHFPYVQCLECGEKFGGGQFGGSKFARRKIRVGETRAAVFRKDRGQIV